MAARKKPTRPAAASPTPRKPRPTVPGGTPAAPADAPAAAGVSGVVKYPYDKLVDPTPPPFPVFGDPGEPAAPFTPDEFKALEEAYDREEAGVGDFVTEARKTPVGFQEVLRDVQRRTAGSLVGDVLHVLERQAFIPNVERWQIPDPEAPGDGENTPSLVQVYLAPTDQLPYLLAPDGAPDTVWTHTWRAMLPDGLVSCTGGKLAAGNQRGGLAAATLTASVVRELTAPRLVPNPPGGGLLPPPGVVELMRVHLDHRARNLD